MMYTVVGCILLDTLHLHYAGILVLKTEHTHYDSHVIWSWSQILFMKFTHLWCRENSVPFFCSLGKSWNASCALPGRLCSTPSRSTLLGVGHRQQEGRSGTSVCLVVCPTCRHTRPSWEHWKPLQLWYKLVTAHCTANNYATCNTEMIANPYLLFPDSFQTFCWIQSSNCLLRPSNWHAKDSYC